MNNIINAINTNITSSNLWNVFSQLVPVISTCTLVGLGFYILRNVLQNVKNMK